MDRHHFDSSDPFENKNIWKRFGFNPEEERNMFFESSPLPPGWNDWDRRNRPSHYDDPEWRSPHMFTEPSSTRMRAGSRDEATSIPIRVVHEQTPPRGNAEDGNDSETSSQASHGSHGSGSSSGHPMRAKITREPRVHHIPIMVEPRDGSTSSGYASDGGGHTANAPVPSQENRDVRKRTFPTQESSQPQPGPSEMPGEDYPVPNVQNLRRNFEEKKEEVKTTPVTLNHRPPPSRSFSANSFGNTGSQAQDTTIPRQRKASSHPPMSSQSPQTPPMQSQMPPMTQNENNVPGNKPTEHSPSPVPVEEPKKQKIRPDPLKQIEGVLEELKDFGQQVDDYRGTQRDKEYRFLDEMLTRCMIKLDNVETEGVEELRQARKSAIRQVQSFVDVLEDKVTPKDQRMELESSIPEETNEGNRLPLTSQKSQEMELEENPTN